MRILSSLLLLCLLTACTPAPAAKLPDTWPTEPGAVIFQIYARGGFMTPAAIQAQRPSLTLLADGRVIYQGATADGTPTYLVGQVPKEALPALYAQLQKVMSDLKPDYQVGTWTDDATTRFSLWTPDGLKATQVYGFHPEPQEVEQEKDVAQRLRTARARVLEAMGKERTPYQPEAATLIVELAHEQETSGEVKDWPASLPPLPAVTSEFGHEVVTLSGAEATAALQQVDSAPFILYRQGEGYYRVAVVPSIPLHPE